MTSRSRGFDAASPPSNGGNRQGRAGVEKPVLHLLPGLSGNFQELAALEAGCSSAIQIVKVGFPDWPEIHRRAIGLDALVKYCLRQITVSPDRPTLLAGYSYGGHVAYAIASELEKAGVLVR